MPTLSPILIVGFLNSRTGLPYKLNNKPIFLTFLRNQGYRTISSRNQKCNELRGFANVLVYSIFSVTGKIIFQVSSCTFRMCSLSLTQRKTKSVFLQLRKRFGDLQHFLFPSSAKFFLRRFFVITAERTSTVSLQFFVFIPSHLWFPHRSLDELVDNSHSYYLSLACSSAYAMSKHTKLWFWI